MSVIWLCSLVAFLDGFDTQSIAPAATFIARDLGLPLSAMGTVFGASQLGFLLGAMIFGAGGDRFGRKRALLVATALFGLASFGTAFVSSHAGLLLCRTLAGLGLGGVTPNFVSLASEHSAPERRAQVVTMMWAAVPFGGMTGSFASAALIPLLTWKAIFVLGGAAPLLLLPLLQIKLPESTEVGFVSTTGETRPTLGSLRVLFQERRALATLILWLVSFMTWMTVVVVAFWTPTLLQRSGASTSQAASILALNNAGGVIGTLLIGSILGRVRPQHMLQFAFTAAALFIAAIGSSVGVFAVLAPVAVLAGFFSSAVAGGVLAVSANTYPVTARASGVGWALGVGRIGSIIGPIAAGVLVAGAWSVEHIYVLLACPALLAAGLIFAFGKVAPSPDPGVA